MNRLLACIFLMHPLLCLGESDSIMEHPNWELLKSDQCGISTSDRIVGGVDAPIGAYPWLARIGYVAPQNRSKKPIFLCAGAIINKLYVLTAAHCVVDVPRKMLPVRIRLGEHNTKTNPDCDQSFCNDPYQDRDVDEVALHEDYDTDISKNDIALIRVEEEMDFTDFVRPICLVKGKLLEKDFSGQIVEVAGWGVYNIKQPSESTILQSIKLPVLPIWKCSNNLYYRGFFIDSTQLCIGGKSGKDSCKGDSGGPVIKIETGDAGESPRYYLIGIVSFGPDNCGQFDLAGIYTNVSKFIPWILDHLKPLD